MSAEVRRSGAMSQEDEVDDLKVEGAVRESTFGKFSREGKAP